MTNLWLTTVTTNLWGTYDKLKILCKSGPWTWAFKEYSSQPIIRQVSSIK